MARSTGNRRRSLYVEDSVWKNVKKGIVNEVREREAARLVRLQLGRANKMDLAWLNARERRFQAEEMTPAAEKEKELNAFMKKEWGKIKEKRRKNTRMKGGRMSPLTKDEIAEIDKTLMESFEANYIQSKAKMKTTSPSESEVLGAAFAEGVVVARDVLKEDILKPSSQAAGGFIYGSTGKTPKEILDATMEHPIFQAASEFLGREVRRNSNAYLSGVGRFSNQMGYGHARKAGKNFGREGESENHRPKNKSY